MNRHSVGMALSTGLVLVLQASTLFAGETQSTATLAELPLAPLPKPAPLTPPPASAADLATVDDLLTRLCSSDPQARKLARQALDHSSEGLVPAGAERLRRIAERADKLAMKELWTTLHSETSDESQANAPDPLEQLLAHSAPNDKAFCDLTSVIGLSRFFTSVGSVEAARQLVSVYIRFGEFLRVDTQHQLEALSLKSTAALIEAERHPAKKIAQWAEHELKRRNLANPSQVVQQAQGETLADILRAYGTTRDADLAKIIISFAGSSQVEVRRAAREATASLGETANWPVRDAYETIVGKRPPREWSWERSARELFRELDAMRMHDVLALYNAGVAAHGKGALDEMRHLFDEVLTKEPSFENADAMAQGYFDFALQKADRSVTDATDTLHRALRLAPNDELKGRIQSLLSTLEGEQLLLHGIADQVLFRRALQLDSKNERARRMLDQISDPGGETPSPARRYSAAIAVSLLAALAVFMLLRRKIDPAVPPQSGTHSVTD